VLVRAANAWLLLPTEHASVREDANIAGEPRDRHVRRRRGNSRVDAAAAGGMRRSGRARRIDARIQITGVLERVLNQTVQYATERIQFGRPIGKFQAIQQQLAVLANEVVASRMAVASACAALSGKGLGTAGHDRQDHLWSAAGRAPAIAHQVHGAIGFTREHSLHYATRRLWSWRAEYGSEAQWAAKLGKMAIEHGGDTLWERLTEAA
jgi:acyl-CoA dehydrogenase